MIRFRPFLACLAVGSAALLTTANAGAQITKTGDAYLFRAKYVKGKTTRYQITMQTMMPAGIAGPNTKTPSSMSMVIPIAITVLSVQGDKATLKSDTGAVMMNGQPISKPQTTQMTMDSRGHKVDTAGSAGGGMGVDSMSNGLPEKPLKVGQSFTSTKSVNQMGQNLQAKTVTTFMGIKNIGGQQVAEMTTKVTGVGNTEMSGTGTSYFNVADGSLISAKMTNSMSLSLPGQTRKMNLKSTTEMKTVGQ